MHAERRHELVAELARTAETLRAILDSTTDIVIRLDCDLHCVYVNPAGERLIGRPAPDWAGLPADNLPVRDSQRSALLLTLQNVLRGGRGQTLELSLRTINGEREFEARVVPEFGSSGGVAALIIVWRDVTDRVRAATERAELHAEVLKGQAELRELLSRVLDAHAYDLRVTAGRAEVDRLTGRQREILRLLSAGRSNREIAAELNLQPGTVKNHVATILTKLDVSDRIQAAVRAVELGLVDSAG